MKLFRVKKSKILGARTYIFEGCLRVNIILFNSLGVRRKGQKDGRTAYQYHGAFSVSVTITGYNSRHFRSNTCHISQAFPNVD